MTTSTTEETGTTHAPATGEKPKPTKKARVAARRAHVAAKKSKSAKRARPAKKASKRQKKASAAREGSKTAKVLAILRQPKGATLKELQKATGWQAHSARGFLSGTLRKKMGLTVESNKREDGERQYKIAR